MRFVDSFFVFFCGVVCRGRRCQVLQMLKFAKGQHHLVVSEAVMEQHEKTKKKSRKRLDPAKLVWKPPTFSRNDLRFGW